jgi:hypothetical protein
MKISSSCSSPAVIGSLVAGATDLWMLFNLTVEAAV